MYSDLGVYGGIEVHVVFPAEMVQFRLVIGGDGSNQVMDAAVHESSGRVRWWLGRRRGVCSALCG